MKVAGNDADCQPRAGTRRMHTVMSCEAIEVEGSPGVESAYVKVPLSCSDWMRIVTTRKFVRRMQRFGLLMGKKFGNHSRSSKRKRSRRAPISEMGIRCEPADGLTAPLNSDALWPRDALSAVRGLCGELDRIRTFVWVGNTPATSRIDDKGTFASSIDNPRQFATHMPFTDT